MRRDAKSPLKTKVLPDDPDGMPCDTAETLYVTIGVALRHSVAQPEGVAVDEQAVPLVAGRLLKLGAAGRLLIAGELEGVLPLEDAAALEQARPTAPDGKLRLDTQKVEDRHDAQVRAVIKEGPVAVIILGGAHDLTASLRRLGYRRCEYLRVTTKRYKEMAE